MRVTRTLRATVGAALTGALLLAASGTASADQARKHLWPLQAFGADQLWKEATGKGVTVAVIDSGFRETHQDLKGQFLPEPEFGKAAEAEGAKNLDEGEKDIRDHGTSMASLIAGHGHGPGGSEGIKGLAPDAKILPIPAYGKGAQATRWAVDHGADVINMSYGGAGQGGDECDSINYALSKGVVVVAAVGNEALTDRSYPVHCPGVIGVGAVDQYGESAEFNNYNSDTDLLAPGVHIPAAAGTSDTGYRYAQGSSQATAYVSAAVALLKEKFPDLTPGQIANRLVKTAGLAQDEKAKHLKLPDVRYGYGYIQPGPALRKDIPAGPKEGPLPMPKKKASAQLDVGESDPNPPAGGKEILNKALLYGGIGAGVLLVIAAVVAFVLVSRRRRNTGGQNWG